MVILSHDSTACFSASLKLGYFAILRLKIVRNFRSGSGLHKTLDWLRFGLNIVFTQQLKEKETTVATGLFQTNEGL
jgi:hypothetical protein